MLFHLIVTVIEAFEIWRFYSLLAFAIFTLWLGDKLLSQGHMLRSLDVPFFIIALTIGALWEFQARRKEKATAQKVRPLFKASK